MDGAHLALLGAAVVAIALVVLVVRLVIRVSRYLLRWKLGGAYILFVWAGQQGFLGVAAYFACWVFLFPIMLVASLIVGFIISDEAITLIENADEHRSVTGPSKVQSVPDEWDRRYEEAKRQLLARAPRHD